MPIIDFPNSPTVNQTYTTGYQTWKWDGNVWRIVTTFGPTGPTGPQGPGTAAVTGTTAPALTNVTLGTGGTHTANWTYRDGMLSIQGKITLGSSGFSMGDARITLPNSYVLAANSYRLYMPVGNAFIWDNSVPAAYTGFILAESNSVMRFRYLTTGVIGDGTFPLGYTVLSSADPMTWAASDAIAYQIVCQVE